MSTPYNQETLDKIEADIRDLEQQPLDGPEPLKALAKAYIDLSKEYRDTGTPTALAQAVAAGEKAIDYAKQLPIEVDEYRDVLASAYIALGGAQWKLGTPTDLQQALASCNHAIQLIKALPLDNHDYRNNLEIAYRRRGNVQAKLGTPSDLHEAIESYNQAIELAQELPLDNPVYRNDLVSTYVNRGTAQSKLGTPADLHQAIESYNQAIELFQALPLDNPEYLSDLAIAYMNRGIAQGQLGTPSDLHQAIESFNQVIELRQALPLENPKYRNDLTSAYLNRGEAQRRLGTPSDLHDAIESFNQAIAFSESLNKQVLEYVKARAKAFGGKALACLQHRDFEEANEAAEAGLELLRDLEISGVYVLRSLREKLFDFTIATYFAMGPHFITEFLLEHLDPMNAGAAPQSEAMHKAALRALQRLYLMAKQGHPEWFLDIQQTLTQLALIRGRYFVGSATGAQLMAQYYEDNAKDFQQAERILADFTQQCPTDVEGYINLANFYQRQQQTSTASQIYETAINTVATNLPKRVDGETLQSVIDILVQLIDSAAVVQFAPAFAQSADSEIARQRMSKHFNQAMRWLGKCSERLPEQLRDAVDTQITEALVPQFEAKQNEWHKQQNAEQFKQWQQQQQSEQARKQQWLLQAAQALSKTGQQLMEAFLKMQADLAQLDITPETTEEISDIVAQRIQTLIGQLHDSELAAAMEKLAQTLTDVWPLLDEQDRKLLATALHCLNDDHLLRFAGLSLGLAVEKNLFERCFQPFCEQLQQTQSSLPEKDKMEECSKKQLTLGSMIWRMAHITDKTDPITIALSEYLSQQPWGIRLLEKKLIGRLRGITEIRNKCAHPNETPTRDEIEKMRKLVVADERAFFRYFVGAFV
jgi:tetratricopeptide (TPR) repeat protein